MIGAFRNFIFLRRHMAACRRLQRMVEANRQAPATREFTKRRSAMLIHTRGG